jgi:uncharacterized protein (TIGR02300 family)
MTKPELGTKRSCAHCRAKFYDLHHSPITCPKCDTVFEVVQVSSRWRSEAARPPVREVEPVVAEIQEDQFVSDAEAQGKKTPGEGPEAEDEVELDDESLNDAAFLEESEEEDSDVTEIIGTDIEIEKGN